MTASPFSLSIVVVTHRSRQDIRECLDRLRFEGATQWVEEVVVVDSASNDGTTEGLAERYPEVRVVNCTTNIGFGRACNLGIAHVRSEFVLLLNPDARVGGATVKALVEDLKAHPRAAAVGPAQIDGRGREVAAAQAFPAPRQELSRRLEPLARLLGVFQRDPASPKDPSQVDWISGACFCLRRRAWLELGGFDPRYFLYFEETDLCHRSRHRGWQVRYRPDLTVLHAGGRSAEASGGPMQGGQLAGPYRASRRRYYRTHHGLGAALWVDLIHLVAAGISWRARRQA